ncbi:D-alanine aminotransferase [Desulfocucumis palustris]|uniref:D-alanine aminotransferase n=1 Tax=Desulfocucumis palustris TaxID=1898651 RepID=A0A2L2XFE1_9FIRM|nr:D-amino-acid transaminase [Desulfocucumis palustris]GBF35069.1 D-alanine aminotransferase [Desulfocucumis palustris]
MGELVYLNGWVGPFEEALISVNDRGYNFGDGVYEVIRVYDGVMFALEDHLKRLEASAAAVEIDLPWDRRQLAGIARDVLCGSGIGEAMVYMQVTRGIAPRNHLFDPDIKPGLLVTVRNVPEMSPSIYSQGVKVITQQEFRWQMCNVKSISLQGAVLAKHRARKAGAAEAVFVLPDGTVTECGASNIFIVKNGVLMTHPADNRILAGITRQYVLELAESMGLPARVEPFKLTDLLAADEVFFTGSVVEIAPVVTVDGKQVSDGRPGPLTERIRREFISLSRKKADN